MPGARNQPFDRLENIENIFTASPIATGDEHFFHYGARLALKNGYLFISVGDRHDKHLAQDLNTHNGSIIRVYDDGRIPEDNPFFAQGGPAAK